MMRYFLLELLFSFALVASPVAVQGQTDKNGFISLDCGLTTTSKYTDKETGLNFTSDAGFIDSGEPKDVTSTTETYDYYRSVRSFPDRDRNCYTLRPENGKNTTYLIIASFYYGNYDGKNLLPVFDLYIGGDLWETVRITDVPMRSEIIYTPSTDYVHVCLRRTGITIPFISALQLRPINNTLYRIQSGALGYRTRRDFGSNEFVRFPDDVYDRTWSPRNSTPSLSTDLDIAPGSAHLPSVVMSTAATTQNRSSPWVMTWEPYNPSDQIYLFLHFAEIQKLESNELRQFNIYLNGDEWNKEYSPAYLQSFTIHSTSPEKIADEYTLSLISTANSTLPPIINAIEVYEVKKFKNLGTNDTNVAAMFGIKKYYGLRRNWQGDPCVPGDYRWEGLRCKYDDSTQPRIISLNLSSSGLNGSIAPHIANLTFIETLDLSNNALDGEVPEFLAELDALKVLNLKGNSFSGTIPPKLLERSKQGSLSLSVDTLQNNASKKRNQFIVPIVASTLATSVVIFFVVITMSKIKARRKAVITKVDDNLSKDNDRLETKRQVVTYSEVLKITNNFERVLGKGGFGTVYYGLMGDIEVAVKMLNPSSTQGYKQFQVEANLLMSVHHKNLTSFVGYCNEGSSIGIIYEYMANGNLQQRLSELSWEQRLKIAVDAAQGLDYMHHGCKPPIIHRDIKPTNILLNHNFQAKLSDFGLSKVFSSDCSTHVSVNTIAGTLGYLDPECYNSLRLTERSDVYSFGVVLLQIITGRPAIDKSHEDIHIIYWVGSLLENGDIRTIVDERLTGYCNIDCARKIVELAMSCVSLPSSKRPTMYNVLVELKECLATVMSDGETEPESLVTGSTDESDYGCLAR